MTMDLRAEQDFVVDVTNDRSEKVQNNETHVCQGAFTRSVERDQQVSIGGNSTTVVSGNYGLEVGEDRTLSVGGSEKLEVGDSFTAVVGKNDSESVGSLRLTVAGGIHLPNPVEALKGYVETIKGAGTGSFAGSTAASVGTAYLSGGTAGMAGAAQNAASSLIPTPPSLVTDLAKGGGLKALSSLLVGSVTRSSKLVLNRMVGGAFVTVALGSITTTGGDAYVETVGGARITSAVKGTIDQTAQKMKVRVGQSIIRKAQEDLSYSANISEVEAGSLVSLSAKNEFEIESAEIVIEASTKLALQAGDAVIELLPAAIQIKGPAVLRANEKIAVTGGYEELTRV